jgi:hypothetical protein
VASITIHGRTPGTNHLLRWLGRPGLRREPRSGTPSLPGLGPDLGALPARPRVRQRLAHAAQRASTLGRRAAVVVAAIVGLVSCSGLPVLPLSPPPYRAEVTASYDRTWIALVRALAHENLPLRAIARDSGVIASDDVITPIGLYADCGRIGDNRIEGEALVAFTVFVERDRDATKVQINSKMRSHAARRGPNGKLRPTPVYQCASTGRFEANLLDSVRELTKE